jgi:1-aminocyclopropane-1-carboxylate deaminase/D-cysteine desulfhydrase-like pyridoxal-dependent ACC family enzyme
MIVCTSVDALTPCEQHDGTWYKRDDLFVPFADVPLSGGKVRQAMALLKPKAMEIRRRGGVVLTATGVHSPQGLIIARVAHEYGLRTVIFVGATSEARALRHPMLKTAMRFNASLDCSARVAYESAFTKQIERWRAVHRGGFHVKFGINLRDAPDAILGSTAEQARNVPAEVTTVVVPVGAGITAAGILLGLKKHCPQVQRVVLVQIAGYDRRAEIDAVACGLRYDYHAISRYPYGHELRRSVANTFVLDPIYEAKAHQYMCEVLRLHGPTVLYWIIGDSSAVRTASARVGSFPSRLERAP